MEAAGELTHVNLSVPGIRCEGCVNTIRLAVGRLQGAAMVAGDAKARTVILTFDPNLTSLQEIERTLAQVGFPPEGPQDQPAGRREEATRHALLYVLLAVGLAAALATAGYLFGFKGFVYELALPGAFGEFSVVAVGAIAGTAAFFSPCVFPLLPAYVSYFLMASSDAQSATNERLWRSLRWGAAAALGIVAVNLAIGGVIVSVGAASPFQPDVREDPLGC
jgi:copper chaperone CopZ